jgi:hypothetical protein
MCVIEPKRSEMRLSGIERENSNIACGPYSVEIESKVFHKMFNDFESIQSSTWRETRAIEQALSSFKLQFSGVIEVVYRQSKLLAARYLSQFSSGKHWEKINYMCDRA